MLLPIKALSPNIRNAFSPFREIFYELQLANDMWFRPNIHFGREIMYQSSCNGRILGIEGGSGAGKSALSLDLVNQPTRRPGRAEKNSILYLLAIVTQVIKAMNQVTKLGSLMITADVVRGVIWPLCTR
jgi:pantothenate kinase-related protein Tda10